MPPLPHRNFSEAQAFLCSEFWEIRGARNFTLEWLWRCPALETILGVPSEVRSLEKKM